MNIGFIARIDSDIQQMKRDTSYDSLNSVRAQVPTKESAIAAGHPESGHQNPGDPPYTRGIHESMYSSKLWTMRQYAGFSSADATNRRFRMLLDQGQTGISVAFDLPTQLGLDSDHPKSEGEVGRVGVPIDSIHDMRRLLDGIDLSEVSTSMTINAPATTLLALYVAVADENGISRSQLRGTIQNDILKEYIARGLYIFPPEASMRLTTDLMNWCKSNTPRWNTISVSGYHMREAGCTAVEEIGLTISNALQYARSAIESGMKFDEFGPRMSFFFGCHNDFFEEIAKFRAARTLWHDLATEHFQPTNPNSTKLRLHTQTAGVTLTAQQPENNTVRVAYQALAAVLGGTQSLHTNSYDEAIGLPTEDSARLALRTQQILASETAIPSSVDPLAGSYLVEELTARLYSESLELINDISDRGGSLACVISGYQQRLIHDSAWDQLRAIENGKTSIIGVNTHTESTQRGISSQKLDDSLVEGQLGNLSHLRKSRDEDSVKAALKVVRDACNTGENIMEPTISALKSEATIGEINSVMRDCFGTWVSPSGV